jgi:DNA-binding LacI/PurR family transcriptional regulator
MVTIREIAETAGVSIATVSRVLSNSGHPVSPQTRSLILQVATDMGYSPNRAARSLRTDRSSLIGVILDNFASNWAPIIIRGIQDVLHKSDYFSLVVNIPWETHSQLEVVQNLMGHSVEGFIFVETWHPVRERLDMLNNKPYVIVHRLFHESDPFSIIPDEIHNSSLMVQHLINLGHRQIAYIAGPADYFSSEQRFTGYQTVLGRAGIPVRTDWVVRGDWKVSHGYQCAQRILSLAERPTAIAAANDQLAYGALLAAQDSGLNVPGDLAIVGYDNDEIARISNPTLTTITLPLFRMGQAAAENLLSQVNNESHPPGEQLIKGEMIVRQSCGSAEGRNIHACDFERD